jgi:restriction endonuclease S subunit
MIDMFAGSGGFTTGYVNFIKEKYPDIDWNKGINKIHHYDMNEDVIKSAGLELFCLTGELPDMNNIKYKNSFTDEFNNKKYMYPITNPPYGGDKIKKTISQEKNEKIKEYIKKELQSITDEGIKIKRQKQLKEIEAREKQDKKDTDKSKVCVATCSGRIQKFAKDNNLTGNDKEACSLMLLMDIVEFGGTAVGVLKEGVFFNKTYKNLRKHLIENFNVREVISVPQDQFENTSTKTSIVIFDNTENKTEKVIFSDLIVERYDKDSFTEINDVIVINEFKGDISGVSDKVVSVATREELLNNSIYSLNSKDYNKQVIVCGEGYELVRLGDICEINKKYILDNKKTYKYVEISDINNNIITNYTNYNKEYIPNNASNQAEYLNILISCVRPKPHKIVLITEYYKELNKFVFSSAIANIKLNNTTIAYFVYSILYIISDNFEKDLCNGSSYPRFSPNILKNIQIPIPKSEDKIIEWVNKISKPYDEKNNKQNKIKELEEYVQNKIKDITDNEECNEVELGSICEIMCGNNLPKNKSISGNYNVYGGGETSYTHNEYNLEGFNILISRVGNNNIKLVNEKFYLTDNGFSLLINDIEVKKYIGYYLLNNEDKILNVSNGSAQKVISKTALSKIKIKIPKDKKLIQELEPTFQEIEKLQEELKESEILYKQLIKELAEEAIPSTATLTEENIKINTKTDSKTPSVKSSVSSSSSVNELKEQCKSLGIKGYSKCKKDELIKLLENHK